MIVTEVIQGTLLVLISWCLITCLTLAYGRWIAGAISKKSLPRPDIRWRLSLWWGLTLITIFVIALNYFVPLGGATAALVILGVGLLLGVAGIAMLGMTRPRWRRPIKVVVSWLSMSWLAVVYLASKALTPVTNYDSGLYHLGSIKYAADFSTIPGIANLYFPFGYSNAQFPLAALLGNGPWDGIGYRLLNGSILILALVDLTSRLLNRRWSWGTFTLLFGLSAAFIPMVAMADDMVTSPTADTSVMLLTIVAASYLADALQSHAFAHVDATIAVTVAGLSVAFRPTMIIFATGILLVAILFVWRKRLSLLPQKLPWVISAGLLSVLAVSSLLRDRILSGWLFYPLSTFPLPVPWLAEDPARWRNGTLAAARDPDSQDGFQTAHSYDWIPSWFTRLPGQWEPWFLLVGLIVTVVTVMFAWRSGAMTDVWPRLLVALVPSLLALTTWFLFSPPSFRFAWGPAVVLLAVPLGVGLEQLRNTQHAVLAGQSAVKIGFVASAVCIGAVTTFSLVERNQFDTITQEKIWRLGPGAISYAITPIPVPATTPIEVGNGLIIQAPSTGDQCWDNYPLCVFYTGRPISARGPSIQDGFDFGQ